MHQHDTQSTCEEDEEEPEAVKEDELKEQDDAKEPDEHYDDHAHNDYDYDDVVDAKEPDDDVEHNFADFSVPRMTLMLSLVMTLMT